MHPSPRARAPERSASSWRRIGDALRRRARPTRPRKGDVVVSYEPRPDGLPDPGEVVWAWIPYEESPREGKDRPAVVIGRVGRDLAVVALTSKGDHGRDDRAAVGSGAWDPARRPSWAKLEHIHRVRVRRVRREGARLDRARFDSVIDRLNHLHGPQLVCDSWAG